MKAFLPTICLAAVLLLSLPQCAQPSGSLTNEDIHAALTSPQMALTPHIPGWLLDPEHIHLLTHQDRLSLLEIASKGTPRAIPVEYYEEEEEGNRGDDSADLFYLYASNSQCLGCRIVEGKYVLIDDLELPKEATAQLFTLLKPYYDKMKAAGKPKLKAPSELTEKEKSFTAPTSSSDLNRLLRKMNYTPVRSASGAGGKSAESLVPALPAEAAEAEEKKSF